MNVLVYFYLNKSKMRQKKSKSYIKCKINFNVQVSNLREKFREISEPQQKNAVNPRPYFSAQKSSNTETLALRIGKNRLWFYSIYYFVVWSFSYTGKKAKNPTFFSPYNGMKKKKKRCALSVLVCGLIILL